MLFVEQLRRYQGYLESAKLNDGLLIERAVTLMGESLAVGDKVLGWGPGKSRRKLTRKGRRQSGPEYLIGFRRWILTSCRKTSTTADVRKVQALGS
jgi:hypothetical protein